MKTIKIIVLLMVALLTLGSLAACKQENKISTTIPISTITNTSTPTTIEVTTIATTIPTTTETSATATPPLSEAYDKVLASGYDANGNLYELVAKESEYYTGTQIEMGVIKNKEWSIPLTSDCPFIGKEGLLCTYFKDSTAIAAYNAGSIYDESVYQFNYIGNGCFHYFYRVWNGNNGSHTTIDETIINKEPKSTNGYKYFKEFVNRANNEGVIVVTTGDLYNYYALLDLETMESKSFPIEYNYKDYASDYSEGVFGIMHYGGKSSINGFYDENGNKVIDLSMYDITNSSLYFENGESTFEIQNDQGTKYNITIDKEGNVINSEKVS